MTLNLTIKTKFLIIYVMLAVAGTVAGGIFINRTISRLLSDANTTLAVEIAKIEKERISNAFRTDINLIRLMAGDATLLAWLKDETSDVLKESAMAVMDRYAPHSSSGRFFYIIDESMNYYTNSDGDDIVHSRYVYSVDKADSSSAWYLDSIQSNDEYVLNLDADEVIGDNVSIYINYPVLVDNKVVALTGTSTPIRGFLDRYSQNALVDTRNILIDAAGSILIQSGKFFLDSSSALKANTEMRMNFVDRLPHSVDQDRLLTAMAELVAGEDDARSLVLTLEDTEWIVGIAYIEQLNWYSISLIPREATPSQRTFEVSFGVFMVIFIIVMLSIWVVMDKILIQRIKQLHVDSLKMYQSSDISGVTIEGDELLSLQNGMAEMQNKIRQQITGLESMVQVRTEELEQRNKELSDYAIKDPLTGLHNRRGLHERFIQEYKRAHRSDSRLGIAILDVDNFKILNDSFGHDVGDQMLIAIANAITTRSEDIHVRWGGEEFVLVFIGIDESQFKLLLGRLVANIRAVSIKLPTTQLSAAEVSVTASIGGLVVTPNKDTAQDTLAIVKELEQAISRADNMMYEVKTSGKDDFKIAS